jgi:hypothetical protein
MVHVIQLCLAAFMSSLGVKDQTKSWEANEHDKQFGENDCAALTKSPKLQKPGNARISKVAAMTPGLAKIIEKIVTPCYLLFHSEY